MQRDKQHILVVEDDLAIRDSLEELLTAEDYSVLTAENGLKAIEILKGLTPPPALILLDLSMPVMNGLTFLKEFEKNFKTLLSVPIVVMTASGAQIPADVHQPKKILRKPLDVEVLIDSIQSLID